MSHVRPEDVFVVRAYCYAVWVRFEAGDEVVAVGAVCEAGEDSSDLRIAISGVALIEDIEACLWHCVELR